MDDLIVTYGHDVVINANKLVVIYSYMDPGIHGHDSDMHAYFNIKDAPMATLQLIRQNFTEDAPRSDGWTYLQDHNSLFSYIGHKYNDRIYLSGDHCRVKSEICNVSISLRDWRQFKLMGSSLNLFPQLISNVKYCKGRKVALKQLQLLFKDTSKIGIFRNSLQTLLRSIDSKFAIEGKKEKSMLLNAKLNETYSE